MKNIFPSIIVMFIIAIIIIITITEFSYIYRKFKSVKLLQDAHNMEQYVKYPKHNAFYSIWYVK